MKKLGRGFEYVPLFLILAFTGCQRSSEISNQFITSEDTHAIRQIGNSTTLFTVLGSDALDKKVASHEYLLSQSPGGEATLEKWADTQTLPPNLPGLVADDIVESESSLTLGYPLSLLGDHQIFGAVVTGVSDKDSEKLGRLKLVDLSPIPVRTSLAKTASGFRLVLSGCLEKCTEGSAEIPLLAIPVVAVDPKGKEILLNLSPLGKELNLIATLDPDGTYTQLKTKTSKTAFMDFSKNTLVFDVETLMSPVEGADSTVKETTFTIRWYLKLTSSFHPAFITRPAVPGVGFFMTDRALNPAIARHAVPTNTNVKYYIKNVPKEFQESFENAFEDWNERLKSFIGKPLLSYEFIAPEDPKTPLLVTGDIRYHILEWDLFNRAPYGGLGPNIANQYTGEIFSANVLVQGPHILVLYKKWFAAAQAVHELRAGGFEEEATAVELRAQRELLRALEREEAIPQLSLSLGKKLVFRVPAQMEALHDPLMRREDFELPPSGISFDKYMHGYFQELVGHELGHNLGLRHNFRGNLIASDKPVLGEVSSSIMEYLGRSFRHLNRISSYDTMAIAYAYTGKLPEFKDRYCTDEDVATAGKPQNSAECSRDDATRDPFSYFEKRFDRAVDLLIARSSKKAPTWTTPDMASELSTAVNGLLLYASSAENTASTWTNFFTGGDRPKNASEVTPYVVKKVKTRVCDPSFNEVILSKEDEEAKKKTSDNIDNLRRTVGLQVLLSGAFAVEDIECQQE